MTRKKLIRRALITALAVLMLTGCNNEKQTNNTETSTAEATTPVETTTQQEETGSIEETSSTAEAVTETVTEVEAPSTAVTPVEFPTLSSETSLIPTGETVRSFYTGEWINDTIGYRRPIAVMINNIEAALPQSGISYADIIFEAQCEGGITRLMGVFQNYDDITSLGSIRSCRDYYIWLAAECDAAYFHFGQSDFALEFLSDPALMTFNGMTGMYNYERATDRVAPHNVFSTPKDLVQAMVNKGVTTYLDETFTGPFKFNKNDNEKITAHEGEECYRLETGYTYNNAYFEYNEEDGLYYRYQYGAPQIDAMTGEQIAVTNIVCKFVPGDEYWNGSPRYLLTGQGLGLVVTNGTASWVRWDKGVDGVNTNLGFEYYYGYGITSYWYFDDTLVELNQGKTWVCIMEQENQPNVKIIGK